MTEPEEAPAPAPQKAVTPAWKLWATRVGLALTALGGGSGIVAIVDAFGGDDTEQQSCASYWDEIGDVKADGFAGFQLLQDAELEDRCGDAVDVADSWPSESP